MRLARIVSITDAGGRRLRALEAVVARLQAELLAPLAAAERRQLVGLLRRLVAHQGTT